MVAHTALTSQDSQKSFFAQTCTFKRFQPGTAEPCTSPECGMELCQTCICEQNCSRRASEIYFRNSFTYPPLKFQWPKGWLSFFPGAFLSSSPATIFISLPVSVQAIQPYFTSSDCCFAICALAASAKDSSYARCKTWQGQRHSHLFSHSSLQPVKQCTFSVMSTAIWV